MEKSCYLLAASYVAFSLLITKPIRNHQLACLNGSVQKLQLQERKIEREREIELMKISVKSTFIESKAELRLRG